MSTPTYTPLATVTLTSSASSVTFSSIPATYRDLVVVVAGSSSSNNSSPKEFRLNGDSGNNYSEVFAFGTSSGVGSDLYPNLSRAFMSRNVSIANPGAIFILNLMDYSITDKHKSFLARANRGGLQVEMTAGRWANTNAITSIEFGNSGADLWPATTVFTLYGIAA